MRRDVAGILLCGGLALFGIRAAGQTEQGAGAAPAHELFFLDHMDESRPLRDMPVIPPPDLGKRIHPVKLLHPPRAVDTSSTDPVRQLAVTPLVNVTPGLSFDGVGVGLAGFSVTSAPPDTNGAVGATQYVQWVNTSFAVFNKSNGALVYGPAAGNSLWQGFGGPCEANNDGDPIAIYDKKANRWVMTQFSVSNNQFFQCVAVSTTSSATGTYRRFAFSFANFNDYPKLGVWPDGYYLSFNMFNASGTSFLGSRACALDRTQMITASGTPRPMQCFQLSSSFGGLLPSDQDGATNPPTGAPNYYVAFGTNVLRLWRFHVDFANSANSTFTGPINIPVASFSEACGGGTCIPQPSTTQRLDSLADRLMYRLAYRNFGTSQSLVVNHSITVGTTPSGVRWYEIRNPGGTPTLFQQGTFSPDATSRWMGSIAMDKQGNMLLGYSASSGTVRPGIRYTGRLAGAAAGTMQSENTLVTGVGSQTGGLSRWGDYSAMTVDPVDDCTFWFTTEYLKASGSFNWSTRIASVKFPSCTATPGFTVSTSPASVSLPRSSSRTATTTVTSLSGFSAATTLSITGLPSGVTASFSPNPVTPPANGSVNSTLTLTASSTATTGTFNLTVTGTSGTTVRSTTLGLTVTTTSPVTVFYDGAESSTTTFTFSSTTSSTVWTRNNTAPFAGSFRWKAGSSTGGNYGNNGDARMTTPTLNLSAAGTASLSYAFKYHTEASFEFFQVRISTNGGSTWTNLVNVSGQSPNWSNWAGTSTLSLNSFVGQTNVRIQFRFVTDGSVTDFGAAVDEIRVTKQ